MNNLFLLALFMSLNDYRYVLQSALCHLELVVGQQLDDVQLTCASSTYLHSSSNTNPQVNSTP